MEKVSAKWITMKVNPAIHALVKEAAGLAKQPEYIVLDILISEGGYNESLTAEKLAGRVQRAITRALLKTRGIEAEAAR